MEILRTISLYTEGKDMPFVVIGGHAVNAYGISRQTGDIDLIVPLKAKNSWLELFSKLKYQRGQDDSRFARFKPDTLAAWPIDLMFVDDSTFAKIRSEAKEHDFGTVVVYVASVKHLITLKLHALKNFQQHRFAKDYGDVLALLRGFKSAVSYEELKELCLKYCDQKMYDRIKKDLVEP